MQAAVTRHRRARLPLRSIAPAAALALAAWGCAADAAERPAPAVAAEPAPPALLAAAPAGMTAAAPPGAAYVAWSADSAGAVSAWIDDQGRVVATRPEVVVAAGSALWAVREEEGQAKGSDCACTARHDQEPVAVCAITAPVPVVALVDLVSGRREMLLRAPSAHKAFDLAFAPPGQGLWPTGSVGPYLFTETRISFYGCGANHGGYEMARQVVDVREVGREVDLIAGDTLRLLAAQAEAARDSLIAESAAFVPLQNFGLAALEPAWHADGRLEMGYRFTAGACWACGDEHSSGYMRSTLVAGPVPAPLAGWASAPEPVRRYWAEHPPRARAGWSEVAAEGAPGALSRFRAR
jgi:hypothetical protein